MALAACSLGKIDVVDRFAFDSMWTAPIVADRRRGIADGIAFVLKRWLNPMEAAELARYFSPVLQGISVQARDGASREQLEKIAEHAVASLRS
ncbi:hypothetical protein [Dyella sp. GSA-30]|uniref:hypothetical protein n=1 Tax=Dyella sp. GSA-30 TaxID=2994496 RepID=UPI002491D726|nr:hypothetical protein [Dyella sp. GSA-30]